MTKLLRYVRLSFILFLTFFLAFQSSSFATPALNSYTDLVHEVRIAFARGKERTYDAVERERVLTYWEVGKLIDEHILLHKERAEYGKEVIKRLSVDIAINESELYRMVRFVRVYPNLVPAPNLSWSHYKVLITINDVKEREEVARKAEAENWSRKVIREEVEKLKRKNPSAVSEEPTVLLIPIKGKLDTYRIILPAGGDQLYIDLGFSNYLELPKKYEGKFKAGDIIIYSQKGKLTLAKDATVNSLFTYRAKILNVTDGDTLWLWVDLGFGTATKQQVRLRGIDAPEIETRDGQAAKKFVEKELSFPHALSGNPKLGSPTKTFGDDLPSIIIATSKSDKYDRYLADIYYQSNNDEKFLNNELLIQRLAERA